MDCLFKKFGVSASALLLSTQLMSEGTHYTDDVSPDLANTLIGFCAEESQNWNTGYCENAITDHTHSISISLRRKLKKSDDIKNIEQGCQKQFNALIATRHNADISKQAIAATCLETMKQITQDSEIEHRDADRNFLLNALEKQPN